MFKALISISVGVTYLVIGTSASWAVDWTMKGVATQAVELNDNQFLRTMLAGGSLGSYSRISTNTEARAPTWRFDIDSDASYRKYWGPGVEGLPSELISYAFKGRYELLGKTKEDRTYFEASYGQQNAALAVFNTLGIPTSSNAFLNQASARAGVERALTSTDSIKVWVNTMYTDYDPRNAGVAFLDTLAVGSWKHQVGSAVAFTAQSELEYVSYENFFNSRAFIARNLAGVEATLSPVLTLRARGGYAFVQTDNIFGVAPLPGAPGFATSNSSSDLVADFRLTYRATKSATISLDAIRSIGPSIIGSIVNRTTFRSVFDYDLNSVSKIALTADFTRLVSPATTDFALASISYSRQLSQSWATRLTYSFLHRTGSTGPLFDPILGLSSGAGLGPASSNSILVEISKKFDVIPSRL